MKNTININKQINIDYNIYIQIPLISIQTKS